MLNEISLTQTLGAEADPVSAAANAEPSLQGDVPSPKTNIPQNGNAVNTLAIRAVSNPKGSQIYNWGIKNDTSLGGVGHTPFGSNSNGTSSDVSKANIPQNGNSVNTPDAENSAAKVQQNSENAAKAQQMKPGTVSAEQMYGVKLSQENKNEDFAEWAEKEDAKKKKAAEKEAILAEKQKNADNSNLTNREKYSLSEQEATEIKKASVLLPTRTIIRLLILNRTFLKIFRKKIGLQELKMLLGVPFQKALALTESTLTFLQKADENL